MVDLNRSKAGLLTAEPVFECPHNMDFLDRWQTSPFQNAFRGCGIVEKKVRYINQSAHDISVIDGTGLVINIPSTNKFDNRLVVCVNFTWGRDTHLDIAATWKHWPGMTQQLMNSIGNNIRNEKTTSPLELDLYYVIPLDDFERDQYGLWLEALNVQIVHTESVKKTTFFTRDCFFSKNDELYAQENIVWTTTTAIAYFVQDEDITESVYMPFGGDLLEVKPVYMPEMKQGIHLNLRGNVTFAARTDNAKTLFIHEKDFKKYGIYSSFREWRDTVKDSTKGLSKEEAAERLKCFEKFHGHLHNDEMEPLVMKDVVLFGNFTVGSLIEFLTELAKADSLLEKIIRKR